MRLVPPRISLAGLALVLFTPAWSAAQTSRGAFITLLGKDTTAVESYVRSGNVITGDYVTRQGGTVVNHYLLTLNSDGSPATFEVTYRRPDGSVIPNANRSAIATFGPDTTVTVITRDTTITRRIAAAHAIAGLGGGLAPALGVLEAGLARVRTGGDSVPMVPLNPAAQRAGQAMVAFQGNEARIWSGGVVNYVTLDGGGRIVTFSGRATTQKVESRRVPGLDVMALAAAFAAADAGGRGLTTVASVRDTVNASIGKAMVWVDYGRPQVRGREVFKNGVLGDTLWRTGANAATQFKTDVDLVVGGRTLPAGLYTLWTRVPADNSSYQLIFNTQTGQWGTSHDASKDLIAVPLQVARAESPAEEFTITVEPAATGGLIRLHWGGTQLSTGFTAK